MKQDRIRMIVFDMAGTTIQENNLVYRSLQFALQMHGFNLDLDQILIHAAGKEKVTAIRDLLKFTSQQEADDELVSDVFIDFSKQLNEQYAIVGQVKLFPSYTLLCNYLRENEIIIVLNTGYSKVIAQKILDQVGLLPGEGYDLLVCSDMVNQSRPHPAMIDYVSNKFEIQPRHIIKVGDTIVDIMEGKNANVKYSIGVTTGAQTRKQLEACQPDFIIDDLLELIPIIENVNK
ncbi:MAG: HAD hydrolase-like protein [Saprospiraceae bacterium]|nr:HAD hydrolase-like protein [Saprospiraceae bacterium]